MLGVMVAWTGIEHFLVGRFDPPPPADEPEDALVCLPCFFESYNFFFSWRYIAIPFQLAFCILR